MHIWEGPGVSGGARIDTLVGVYRGQPLFLQGLDLVGYSGSFRATNPLGYKMKRDAQLRIAGVALGLAGVAALVAVARRRKRRVIHRYGAHPSQYIRVAVPNGDSACPVAVIVHGGFWKNKYAMDSAAIETLAPFLVARGFAAVEVEYRRCDDEGGAWPGTALDVLAALEAAGGCAEAARFDRARVVLLGHSAGGQLALYAAHHSRALAPCLTVALAPVADLVAAHRERLSDDGDAVHIFMGRHTPEEAPDAYRAASPAASMLPLVTPTLLATGADDADVPARFTTAFHEAARVGAKHPLRCLVIPGADHYDVTDASSNAWAQIFAAIQQMMP